MRECKQFATCDANLCPHDVDLEKRTWIIGEAVCRNTKHREDPWIRRQRQLNRTRPKGLLERTLSHNYLVSTAPKKRTLSEEQRAKQIETLKRYREAQKAPVTLANCTNHLWPL